MRVERNSYEGGKETHIATGIINKYNIYRYKIFECEYKNGTINGKVKKYYSYPRLKIECKYLNNEKHGKVKEYNYDGKLIFEGEYLNNHDKKGKKYVDNYLEFEGEIIKKNGMEKDMIKMEILFMN